MTKLRTTLFLLSFLASHLLLPNRDPVAYAQQASINNAVPAVVRILGCNVADCNVGLGSGALIHPSGVVLTANHVTLADPKDPTSQLEDFLIEMSVNAQSIPEPRYRARLIAFKPDSDLALLRIYWDEGTGQAIDTTTLHDLPTLPLADGNTIMLGERLHILGYPLAGGRAVNYIPAVVGGFDENGTLLKVSTTLSEGNSGGPALVERNGGFEIGGVVLRRRGTLGEVGLSRRIDQLQGMQWLSNAQRVWADEIQIIGEGTDATSVLQISAEINALDMVDRHIYLLAYAFDATTYQPWRPSTPGLPKSATGQVVFSQEFVAQHIVETAQTITFDQRGLGMDPQQLLFRLLLWDSEATQVLWQDSEWRRPQPTTAVALAPSTATPTQVTTSTPVLLTPTPTDTPMAPTETATMTSPPDLVASATAIARMLATSIAATLTAQPTATPTFTPTPNLAATATAETHLQETAIAATLTAQPTATPTPTEALSFEQVIATAVAATLTALPTNTPTRMSAHTPTVTLMPTPTNTKTRTPTPAPTPTATIDADPAVYDNFDRPKFDLDFDRSRWRIDGSNNNYDMNQRNGNLEISLLGQGEIGLVTTQYDEVLIDRPTFVEARLRLEPKTAPSGVHLFIELRSDLGGAECGLFAIGSDMADWRCSNNFLGESHNIAVKQFLLGSWHTVRIEIDPTMRSFRYFIDSIEAGSSILPTTIDLTKVRFSAAINLNNFGMEATWPSGSVDYVRIGPIVGSNAIAQTSSALTPTLTWTPTRVPTRTSTSVPCKPGVLYCEDFEDGRADGWGLYDAWNQPSSGWKVIQDGANHVFSGEGHQIAVLDNRSWDDYRVRFRFKLSKGEIHLVYRVGQSSVSRWTSRYYVGIKKDGIYLNKSLDGGGGFNVYSATNMHTLETWHTVEMAGWGGQLLVYVDGKLEVDYTDPTPVLRGTIAFSTMDNSTAQIDDIEVIDSKMITPGVADQLRSALWSNAKSCQSVTQSGANDSPVDINSPWRTNSVVFDGLISTAEEWSEATCLDLDLIESQTGPSILASRWWLKNDEQWLYLLARVPSNRSVGDGAYIEYFWPHPYTGLWQHSDRVYIRLDGTPFDEYGWDEQKWSDDTQAAPPGNKNVTGAANKDTTYRWFEFRKALNSGDGYDWALQAGQTYGDEGALLIGIYDVTSRIPFERYIRLKLGTVIASDSLQPSSSTSIPSSSPELVIDAANLNVREGPGSSYKVLGVANSGARYTITGRNSNSTWWQIDFNGRSGWVSGGYVRLLNSGIKVPVTSSITQPLNVTPVSPSASGQRGSNCSVFWYGSNHSYLAVQDAVTWDVAKSRAEQIGGYLATIRSWEENEFVYALVRDNDAFWSMDQEHGNGLGPWLGGYQIDGAQEPDGGWRWVKNDESFSYQNWANGEPNNSQVNEKFLGFFGYLETTSSKWNDYPPDNVLNGYVVEFDRANSTCIDTEK